MWKCWFEFYLCLLELLIICWLKLLLWPTTYHILLRVIYALVFTCQASVALLKVLHYYVWAWWYHGRSVWRCLTIFQQAYLFIIDWDYDCYISIQHNKWSNWLLAMKRTRCHAGWQWMGILVWGLRSLSNNKVDYCICKQTSQNLGELPQQRARLIVCWNLQCYNNLEFAKLMNNNAILLTI